MWTNRLLWLIALLVFISVGCESEPNASRSSGVDARGARYILTTEPSEPLTPTDIKESALETNSIAVAGRIDAGEAEPFQEGFASFMISQLPDASHADGDPNHADNCPFCKRRLKNAPKAIVRVLDEAGEVIQVDARKLLGLAKGDTVVVRGKATYLEPVNTVQIDADGVFVR